MISILDKIVDFVAKIIKIIVILCAIALVVVVFTEVVLRYVFSTSLLWNDEGSRFLFVWIVYFAMAYAVYNKSHIRLDIISEKVPVLVTPLKILTWCTTTMFFVIFFKYSLDYTIANMGKLAPATNLPYVIIYGVLPVSAAMSLLFLFHRAVHFIFDKPFSDNAKEENS